MVHQYVLDLHLPLSAIRLERYRPKDSVGAPTGSNLDMLVNYFWNMALAESLYPALHAVEIALRNTLHATLTNRYQTEEWWHDPSVRMLPRQHATIVEVERDHIRQHQAPITPGKLVSELNFGFWTTLLSFPYESRIWRYQRFVLLSQAFPHAIGLSRPDIHRRFNDVRFLRNRVMHYEAVYDRPNLATEQTLIHGAIQWVSPELHRGVHAVDSFPDIFSNGRDRVYQKLHHMLGGP